MISEEKGRTTIQIVIRRFVAVEAAENDERGKGGKKDESKTPVENTIKRQEKSLSLFSMRFIAKSIGISGFFLRLYSSRRRELLGQ